MTKQTLLKKEEIEIKIRELLEQMTVEEKVGQLNQVGPSPVGGFEITMTEMEQMLKEGRITKEEYEKNFTVSSWNNRGKDVQRGHIGSFLGIRNVARCNHMQRIAVEDSRLHIPLLIGLDVVHGLRTIFPIPLAESCAWDEALFEKSAEIAAKEAAATGINWTFAPMVDIGRDARWGRVAEGAGEDPYLTSCFARAKVRGFQGTELSDPDRIAACAKHFVAYGAATGGRDYGQADMSPQTLLEYYMPPFEAACEEGVASFMPAFNDVNGEPCTSSGFLLSELLCKQWGFNGVVVSDSGAVGELVAHGTVDNRADATKQAVEAGIDIDMSSMCFTEELAELVRSKKVSMDTLDEAVRRVLRIKYELGLFEHPYVDETLGETLYLNEEHTEAARDAARRSAVLLKNDGLLPLKNNMRIAVVGELAANKKEMLGTWAGMGRAEETMCLLDGLKERGVEITYAPCCSVTGVLDLDALKGTVQGADVVIATVGEYADMSGEASSLCNICLHGEQEKMLFELERMGKPFITVLFNGRPLAVPETVRVSNAVLEAWHLGSQAGNAICDILFGDYNPSGRLTTTFPHYSGQCPMFYNHTSTGRPTSEIRHSCKYMDAPLTPLFPFGYGLSYTEYQYSDLKVTEEKDRYAIEVIVENIGSVAGEETVQVYVCEKCAKVVRPVRELKAFGKVFLQPGERKICQLFVNKDSLYYFDMQMNRIVHTGPVKFFVGHDSTCSLSYMMQDQAK